MSKIRVKFLIDKEQKRVIFAEAGSDFVDVLLSFLTLPLGSIVRLLGKKSGLGSLDSLYETVEKLDENYLQTDACKKILLNPRSATALICEDLKIKNIHHPNPRVFYFCNSRDCYPKETCYFTFVENIKCSSCGKLMNGHDILPKYTSQDRGIFVNETFDFFLTDNLRLMPISLIGGSTLLKEMRVNDASMLEERLIDFGTEEALNLLRKSLVSKNPLTEICFPDACVQSSVNCSLAMKEEPKVNEEESKTTLKLIFNKSKNDVFLYAEVGERFANKLLSFLTFPLGSVLRIMSDNLSELDGCISNLYSSVENMSLDSFKSENHRNMLLTPKLAAFYGFEQQFLNLEEISLQQSVIQMRDSECYFNCRLGLFCKHKKVPIILREQNPKSGKAMTYNGEAYMFTTKRFMVADNLHISPLSFISAFTNDMNLSNSDLVGKDACFDKTKAMSLLSTMLITSNTVLTDVFCPKLMRYRRFK